MSKYTTILKSVKGYLGEIVLNRPDVHHAINIEMIREITHLLSALERDRSIRIVLFRAPGENFSSGADLNWMREGMDQSRDQLEKESMELAGMFRLIWEAAPVVVTAVQGKVLGGANGIVAASDIVIAEDTARFSFSEVKLGLVPATIAPFVVRKAGFGRSAEWMLTGRMINAAEAHSGGLVHYLCKEGTLEQETGQLVYDLLSNGPEAMKGIKHLLRQLFSYDDPLKIQSETAKTIARFRISPEGQEGLNSFFEKRKPSWNDSKEHT
jgi:methylglutaconyl-CoA hydratase